MKFETKLTRTESYIPFGSALLGVSVLLTLGLLLFFLFFFRVGRHHLLNL